MSVAPVVNQLRDALRERTRLENDFKTKILNRINAILEGLRDCDPATLPPAAAGVLNIAIGDLNEIVREIRNPINMTDAHVEQIVEPLERRRRNETLRLLPRGRPADGPRDLSAPAPDSSLSGPRSLFGSLFSRNRPASAVTENASTPRGSSIYRNGPPSLFDLARDSEDPHSSVQNTLIRGGKRTRRKYHRKA